MGLTIHYSGILKEYTLLPHLIAEVKDISEVNGWPYDIFETALPPDHFGKDTFDKRLYGISFSPGTSEPVWLSFLSNGRLSGPHLLEIYGGSENPADRKNLYLLSARTQYAGITMHKIVVRLLQYIERKYLSGFKVYDEGQYWETGDEQLLEEVFRRYNTAVDILDEAVSENQKRPDESYEEYFRRLLKKKGLR